MSKIFTFNEKRNGSYISSIENLTHTVYGTGKEFIRGDKGVIWKGNNTDARVQWEKGFNLAQDWSLNIEMYLDSIDLAAVNKTWYGVFIISQSGFNYTDGFLLAPNRIVFWDGVATAQNFTNPLSVGYHNIQITHDVSEKTFNIYTDGVFNGTHTYPGTLLSTPTHIGIGYQSTGSGWLSGGNQFSELYDHILTEKERAKLYKEFLDASPITRTIR